MKCYLIVTWKLSDTFSSSEAKFFPSMRWCKGLKTIPCIMEFMIWTRGKEFLCILFQSDSIFYILSSSGNHIIKCSWKLKDRRQLWLDNKKEKKKKCASKNISGFMLGEGWNYALHQENKWLCWPSWCGGVNKMNPIKLDESVNKRRKVSDSEVEKEIVWNLKENMC